MTAMAASKRDKVADDAEPVVPQNVLLRLDKATRKALSEFVRAQKVPPTAPAVGMVALHQFLEREGFPVDDAD